MANYRLKPLVSSNVYPDVRICGMFAVTVSSGVLGTITRPSAGSGATAGKGELFTVTQPDAVTNKWQYLVTLSEQYFAPVSVGAWYQLVPPSSATTNAVPTAPTAGLLNNASTAGIDVFVTAVDVPIETGNTGGFGSNSFYISLTDGTSGALITTAPVLPSGYTLQICFEGIFKNSVAPTTL